MLASDPVTWNRLIKLMLHYNAIKVFCVLYTFKAHLFEILFALQVVKLDAVNKKVTLDSGAEISFDKCLIATGMFISTVFNYNTLSYIISFNFFLQ